MKVKQTLILLIITLIVVSGCSLQKRTYRKGYYVHWNSSLNKKDKISGHKEKKIEIPNNETPAEEPLTASTDKNFILPPKKLIKDSIKKSDCGDSLWSSNGSVSLVKILEINETVIKYKRCANLEGPTIVIPRSSVSKIKYSNGFVEDYREIKKPKPVNDNTNFQDRSVGGQEKKGEPSNLHAFISLMCAVGFLSLLGLSFFMAAFFSYAWLLALFALTALVCAWVFSTQALRQIRKSPEEHSGKGMATAALIISIVGTALILLALIIVIIIILLLAGI